MSTLETQRFFFFYFTLSTDPDVGTPDISFSLAPCAYNCQVKCGSTAVPSDIQGFAIFTAVSVG